MKRLLSLIFACRSPWVLEHRWPARLLQTLGRQLRELAQAPTKQGRQTLTHTSTLLFNLRP